MDSLKLSGDEIADVSGLAIPVARWALTWAWLLTVILLAVEGHLLARPLTFAVSSALVLGALLLVTSRSVGPLRPGAVSAIVVLALAGGALELAYPDAGGSLRVFMLASVPPALLIPRGHPRAGAIGLGSYALITLVWGISTGQPLAYVLDRMSFAVVAALFSCLWWAGAVAVVRREQAALTSTKERMVRNNAAQKARTTAEADLAHVASLVTPILREIADGRAIDERMARLLTVVEGDVRDRLRAASLRDSAVSSAVAAARWRGVRVVLLTDHESDVDELSTGARVVLCTILADPLLKSVTVRRLPPGRVGVFSVVAEIGDATERLLLDEDGHLC